MTEIDEQSEQRDKDASAAECRPEEPIEEETFVALAQAIERENERLTQLAAVVRGHAQQLVGREQDLGERERRVWEAEEALARRHGDLDQRERYLNELAGRAEEVEARLAEVTERERALIALAHELVERYRQP